MRVVDLIDKKKRYQAHTKEEIDFLVNSFMEGSVPDYQISAWLMAVYFASMTEEETIYFTEALINSGEVIDFGEHSLKILDKHSTGGVGDKLSLTLLPLLASCGISVAKLSGRGLGHTGGTIDKLESIPGFFTELSLDDFIKQIEKIGFAISAQTPKLTPADGKFYALRDVTATVDSMPLIAASVVSKKIASGADSIILDVKYGLGAFMKTPEDAVKLSRLMVNIGKGLNKKITAVVTSMNEPLGRAIGNSIEVVESIEFLKGNLQGDLAALTYDFAALSLIQSGLFDNYEEAKKYLITQIQTGVALDKFKEFLASQGGDVGIINDYEKLPTAKLKHEVKSLQSGFINSIDAYKIACACKLLGAGRDKKNDEIDYSVGVYLNKKHSEYCNEGEILYTIYANDVDKLKLAQELCDTAFSFSQQEVKNESLIYEIVT